MIIKFCVFSEKKLRVDIYLSALFSDFSRSYIQKIIDKWQVCVNWKIISKNLKISPKDELQIEIIPEKLEILPQKMDLDIIFEDENILIINKNFQNKLYLLYLENQNLRKNKTFSHF